MKQFGGRVTKALKNTYSLSPNWRDGQFQNIVETKLEISFQNLPKLLYKQFCDTEGREPKKPIPILPFEKETFLANTGQAKFIWYGHSVLLIRINNRTLLIDPMLGPNASPIAPFATKRFSTHTLNIIDELPDIDLVLLTHDHYDHLDMDSIRKLMPKVKHYFTALGAGRHLAYWGVDKKSITEFDWWGSGTWEGIQVTFTPTRHFSGRGLTDRYKSLWGGWAIKANGQNLYFSGDGGYEGHFKTVGERLGPFDIGFMECGQYNENWRQIHMFPEESIQAAMEAGVKLAMPVHWAGFALAHHHWKEPVQRFINKAAKEGMPTIAPKIGEAFTVKENNSPAWWDQYE